VRAGRGVDPSAVGVFAGCGFGVFEGSGVGFFFADDVSFALLLFSPPFFLPCFDLGVADGVLADLAEPLG
jgi:hypothetical protein